MADAVGTVTKVVELALKIKAAVDTVRQNRKDCAHIKRRVERVRHTLSLCEGNAELMESPAVRDAVEALAEVLGEALELVTGCQEDTNAVCLYCTAGNLSKKLGKVDRGISDGNSEATFAILVYHVSKQSGDGARPAISTETEEMPEPLGVDETPEQISENEPNFFGSGEMPKPLGVEETPEQILIEEPHPDEQHSGFSGMTARWRGQRVRARRRRHTTELCAGSGAGYGGGYSAAACDGGGGGGDYSAAAYGGSLLQKIADDSGDQGSPGHGPGRGQKSAGSATSGDDGALLQEIAGVTRAIRTAMEMVRRNKDECAVIDKIASRANVLVSQLEGTETTTDTTVIVALKNLLRTFRYAHELVTACQRRSVVVLCSPGKPSSELRGVVDEMMLGLDDLIDVLL